MNKGRVVRGSGFVPETNFAYMTVMHGAATVSGKPIAVTGQFKWDTTVSSTIAQEASAEVGAPRTGPSW